MVAPVAAGAPVVDAAPAARPGGAEVLCPGADGLGARHAGGARLLAGRVRQVGEEAPGAALAAAAFAVPLVRLLARGPYAAVPAVGVVAFLVAHPIGPADGAAPDGEAAPVPAREAGGEAAVGVATTGAVATALGAGVGAGDVVADLVRAGAAGVAVVVQAAVPLLPIRGQADGVALRGARAVRARAAPRSRRAAGPVADVVYLPDHVGAAGARAGAAPASGARVLPTAHPAVPVHVGEARAVD